MHKKRDIFIPEYKININFLSKNIRELLFLYTSVLKL